MLALMPWMTLALFLTPVLVGLAGTLAPAFGHLPAIGATGLSLAPWQALFAAPGLWSSLRLTLLTGGLASLLALVFALALAVTLSGRPAFARLQSAVTPLLAAPHASLALGLAFLLAPSGFLVRLVSPELTGWTRPPSGLVTIRDPDGLALVLGLLAKEIPYLTIAVAAALGQVPAARLVAIGRTMGYAPADAFLRLVLPRLWPQLRLPFYAVVAYSLSGVDQALVLAPGNPPPLAVLAARWFSDYDLALHLPAAAAALLQLCLVVAALAVARLAEAGIARIGRAWIARGGRSAIVAPAGAVLAVLALAILALGLAALALLGLASLAGRWPFPDAWPSALTLATWTNAGARLTATLATTLGIAAATTALALVLCLGCLEHESRRARPPGNGVLWLIYLPLIVPQIAFLFGAQVMLVRLGLDGTLAAVIWAHLTFVLPYVFLTLADPWRSLDPRYARSAASLGASPARVLATIKLPLLLRPLLVASAFGMTVSIGLYLPTLFAGAGRVATLTTEALTLAGGSDRGMLGVLGFSQAALPLLLYGLALTLPRLVFRHRKGLA